MKITVTMKDIQRGMPEAEYSCPIALAVKRRTHKEARVLGSDSIRAGKTQYYGPRKIDTFIERFDVGMRVRPFSFEMKPVKY